MFRTIPLLTIAAYLIIALDHRPGPALGLALFALAGLGCSALLPSIISFGQKDLAAMHGSAAAALIAAYQIGYALAAFTVSPMMAAGLDLGAIFAIVRCTTAVMTVLIYPISRSKTVLLWRFSAARGPTEVGLGFPLLHHVRFPLLHHVRMGATRSPSAGISPRRRDEAMPRRWRASTPPLSISNQGLGSYGCASTRSGPIRRVAVDAQRMPPRPPVAPTTRTQLPAHQ